MNLNPNTQLWNAHLGKSLGALNTIDSVIGKHINLYPGSISELRNDNTIIIASDYSDSDKKANHSVYDF
jgi:hypothetical protein